MSNAKQASKRKRRSKALPVLGAAGLSFSLASGASSGPAVNMPTPNTGVSHEITLAEEEISDVSLATFYVFDKENAGTLRPGVQLVRGGCGGGCGGGGGCRGCGGGGGCCRGCAGESTTSGLVAPPPLLLGCLPCRVTGIAAAFCSASSTAFRSACSAASRAASSAAVRAASAAACAAISACFARSRSWRCRACSRCAARPALATAMARRCCRFSMAAGPSTSDVLNFATNNFLASDACLRRSSKFGTLRLLMDSADAPGEARGGKRDIGGIA